MEDYFLRTLSSASSYSNGELVKDLEGWVDTGDLVKIEGNRFFVIGRESGIINIGGDKVNPEHVRHVLLEHPDINQVKVFGKKSPITGMVLAANVQLKANVEREFAKTSIKIFIKKKFQMKYQPRILRFVDDIEVALSGKLGGNDEKQ
jgi:acyl-coenzyme A synthetase/AMP-(fatty) acid ligase